MKCKHCGKEQEDVKALFVPELNITVRTKVEQHGTAFKDLEDLVVPEGWRLLTLNEAIHLLNDKEWVKRLNFRKMMNDFFIQQPFKNNKERCAWLSCVGDSFHVYAEGDLNYDSATRGVFTRGVLLCKEGEQE